MKAVTELNKKPLGIFIVVMGLILIGTVGTETFSIQFNSKILY